MLKWIKGITDGHSQKRHNDSFTGMVETSARNKEVILEKRTKGTEA